MNMFDSEIANRLNGLLSFVQNKLEILQKKSFFIKNIDFFVFVFILLTIITASFGSTGQIGAVSLFVPLLVFIRLLTCKTSKIEFERWNFYLLIYLLICFLTNFTSTLPAKSFYGFSKTLVYIMFYFSACLFFKNNRKYIMPVLCVIALVIGIQSGIGIFQDFLKLENISGWQDRSYLNPEDVLTRVYGTLKPYNPNLLAGFLLAGISFAPCMTAIFIKAKKPVCAAFAALISLCSLYAVFLTGCRGAYLAIFAALIFAAIVARQTIFQSGNENQKKIWNVSAILCCAFTALFLLFNNNILKRLMSIFILRGDSSTSFRMNVYNSALQMAQDNFIFGIGCGNKVFREIYGLYMLTGYDALSSYCIYLEMVVESGIFALAAYLLFLFSILKAGIGKFLRENDFTDKTLILGCLTTIIAVSVHGISDTIYFRPQVQYVFWTVAAMLTALVNRPEKQS